jgi:hypothetical protein
MVWVGLVLSVVGAIVIGAGIIGPSLVVSLIGVALLAVGTFLAAKGGGLYDATPEFEAHKDVRAAIRGEVLPGAAPGDMIDETDARADAAETTALVRHTESRRPTEHEPWAQPMGVLIILVAVVLLVAQGVMTQHNPNGMNVSLNMTYMAILTGLVGFRIAVVPGKHPIAVTIALLVGIGLVLQGVLDRSAGEQAVRSSLVALELICGVVVILAGLTALASPVAKPEDRDACQ